MRIERRRRRRRRARASRSTRSVTSATIAHAARRAASGDELRVHARCCSTRPARRSRRRSDDAASAARVDSPARAISARRAMDLRRRAQSGRRADARARRSPPCRAPSAVTVLLCVLARQGLARDDSTRSRRSRRASSLTDAPTAPASRALGRSTRRATFARALGVDVDAEPDFDAALRARGVDAARRCSSPAPFTPSATRWRACRCLRSPGSFSRMFKGALPGFRDFYPQEFAERAYIMATWRDVARRYAFVEYDGPPLEPLELYTRKSGDEIVGQLYNFVDKGGREVALRPEMTPTRRAHGRGARERAAQAGALVLDAAALPLRAPAEGTAARALPAQRRHRRRGRRRRRRRAGRRAPSTSCAAFGLDVERRRACASPTVGCCRRILESLGVPRRAVRRRVRRDRQAGATAARRLGARSWRRSACPPTRSSAS